MGAVFYLKRQIFFHPSPIQTSVLLFKRSAWARATLQKLGGAIAYICVHCLRIRAKRGEGEKTMFKK